jgi:hypothetical protein
MTWLLVFELKKQARKRPAKGGGGKGRRQAFVFAVVGLALQPTIIEP